MSRRRKLKGVVIVPAHNEGKNIEKLLKRIKLLGQMDLKIVVVDDGSNDRTKEIAMNYATVIPHVNRKGKGQAVGTGLTWFRMADWLTPGAFDYVVIIDSDGQYNPAEIPRIVDGLKDANYIVGSRAWGQVPFRHWLGNLVWVRAFNFLYGTKLKDVCCGFVAMDRETALRISVASGYVNDVYMIIQALKMGHKVENVPVNVKYFKLRKTGGGVRMVLGILIFMLYKSAVEDVY